MGSIDGVPEKLGAGKVDRVRTAGDHNLAVGGSPDSEEISQGVVADFRGFDVEDASGVMGVNRLKAGKCDASICRDDDVLAINLNFQIGVYVQSRAFPRQAWERKRSQGRFGRSCGGRGGLSGSAGSRHGDEGSEEQEQLKGMAGEFHSTIISLEAGKEANYALGSRRLAGEHHECAAALKRQILVAAVGHANGL